MRAKEVLKAALMADAAGVPHEFKPGHAIPPTDEINLVMPPDYPKTYPAIPYGTWSDDGSQLLCLLESLAENRGLLDLEHFAHLLLRWRHSAWHQSGGLVFDCGLATDAALQRIARGVAPDKAGGREVRSNGNGSLMRCLPAALAPVLWGISTEQALEIAMCQSVVTHAHPISRVSCAVYVALAMRLWREPDTHLDGALRDALAQVRRLVGEGDGMGEALNAIEAFGVHELPTGGGYVVDCLWSAIQALDRAGGCLDAIRRAISLGNDTDTTAIVTAGLAALRFGISDIPADWWCRLNMPAETRALLDAL